VLRDEINANLINSFAEINLNDPFPQIADPVKCAPCDAGSKRKSKKHEHHLGLESLVNEDLEDITAELVYDEGKFRPSGPPTMTWVPSKVLMRKLMRVCTTVNDFTDLYYFF